MKTLKLAVAVVALTCVNARAMDASVRIGNDFAGKLTTAAIGGALGYVVEQQLFLNSQADKSTKMRTLGYGTQLATVSTAMLVAAIVALGVNSFDEAKGHSGAVALALVSAAAVFTYNSKSRADQNELYEAINDASSAANAQDAAAAA